MKRSSNIKLPIYTVETAAAHSLFRPDWLRSLHVTAYPLKEVPYDLLPPRLNLVQLIIPLLHLIELSPSSLKVHLLQ